MKTKKQKQTKPRLKMKHRLHKKLLQALDLPVDADGSVLKITMVANTDLLIENHNGVIRYTETLLRLHTEHGVLRVEGQELQLSEFAMERAYIRGKVCGWCFEDQCGCGIP